VQEFACPSRTLVRQWLRPRPDPAPIRPSRRAHQAAAGVDNIRRTIEERLGVRVEPLDFRGSSLRERMKSAPDLLDALAPALGIVLRERVA